MSSDRAAAMDFGESLPGVTHAQVVIDLADGTRYTYELNAAGVKVAYDGGHDLALRGMELDLGPVFLPEIPRVWPQPQLAFAFPLTVRTTADPPAPGHQARVTAARTPPPSGDGRTPWQADRDRTEQSGTWPASWGPYHRHFASDEIHRDGGPECDQPGAPRRVYLFDPDALDAHERAVAAWAAAQAAGVTGTAAAEEAGEPGTWDIAFREGRARGLEEAGGVTYRDAWLHAANTTRNARGEWVPSIPLPLHGIRKRCECGRKFWTSAGYRGHYALGHILYPRTAGESHAERDGT